MVLAQTEVTLLTPALAPLVLDDPVVLVAHGIVPVANNHDGVVSSTLALVVEDTMTVMGQLVAHVNGHSHGTVLLDGVVHCTFITMRSDWVPVLNVSDGLLLLVSVTVAVLEGREYGSEKKFSRL